MGCRRPAVAVAVWCCWRRVVVVGGVLLVVVMVGHQEDSCGYAQKEWNKKLWENRGRKTWILSFNKQSKESYNNSNTYTHKYTHRKRGRCALIAVLSIVFSPKTKKHKEEETGGVALQKTITKIMIRFHFFRWSLFFFYPAFFSSNTNNNSTTTKTIIIINHNNEKKKE